MLIESSSIGGVYQVDLSMVEPPLLTTHCLYNFINDDDAREWAKACGSSRSPGIRYTIMIMKDGACFMVLACHSLSSGSPLLGGNNPGPTGSTYLLKILYKGGIRYTMNHIPVIEVKQTDV